MKYLEILRAKLAAKQAERDEAFAEMEEATAAVVERSEAGEDDTLTEEEQEAFDEARETVDALDEELEEIRGEMEPLITLQERQDRLAKTPVPTIIDRTPDASRVDDPSRLSQREAVDAAKATLEHRDVMGLEDFQAERVTKLLDTQTLNFRGDVLARTMLITETDAYRSAWQKLVTQPQPVLTSEEGRAVLALQEMRATMNITTDTQGGFGVPVLIDPSIILTGQGALNPLRRISRVEAITNDAWRGVSSAGVTWSFDAEAAEVSDDSPAIAQPIVNTHKAQGFIEYTIEVGGDYPGFATEMSTLLGEGYNELLAQKLAVGAGDSSNEPFGIITALDATTAVEVTPTTDGTFGAVDVNKVWQALPDKYKANATWVMSHSVGGDVSGFSSTGQGSFFTVDLTQGDAPRLKGRPVEFASYFPVALATTGAANILVVGDFRNYLIAERVGMSVELVPHVFGSTYRPTGQRGWYAWSRVGADSVNDLGFRLLQNQ